jgi:hypothetical protein
VISMDILGNLDFDKIFKMVEQKAPELGTLYGVLAPLAATSKWYPGESAIDAIVREVTALADPQIPTVQGVMAWWKAYGKEPAMHGVFLWIAGEFLGNSHFSKAGINVLKGTAISALIGEVGKGGGAPYGRDTESPSNSKQNSSNSPQHLNENVGAY